MDAPASVTPILIEHADIARAVARLRAGELVAFPTETVYGLGADALNPAAVARVFATKGRPSHNPLIVHVASIEMARSLARHWPREADLLARAFWPGPLTIVVPKAPHVPESVTAGGDTVALRQPAHPVAQALLDAFSGPLVGPSANRSGHVSPTTAAHVRAEFADSVPSPIQVLDGGPCAVGVESTVVMLDGSTPRILRPGAIGAKAIARALGISMREVEVPSRTSTPSAHLDGSRPLASPGLLESHYAPRTHTIICRSLARTPPGALIVRLPSDPRRCAAELYHVLRSADELAQTTNAQVIALIPPRTYYGSSRDPLWLAIRDRVRRATAPRK